MLGEATQEASPFDEILVTDLALLGDTPEEVEKRTRELEKNRVRARSLDAGGSHGGGEQARRWGQSDAPVALGDRGAGTSGMDQVPKPETQGKAGYARG